MPLAFRGTQIALDYSLNHCVVILGPLFNGWDIIIDTLVMMGLFQGQHRLQRF